MRQLLFQLVDLPSKVTPLFRSFCERSLCFRKGCRRCVAVTLFRAISMACTLGEIIECPLG